MDTRLGPFFVVGAPRTGTTMMREVLNQHPRVYLFNEVHFCERVLDVLGHDRPLDAAGQRRAYALATRNVPWEIRKDDPAAVDAEVQAAFAAAGGRLPDLFAALMQREAAHHGADIWGDSAPQDVLYLETLAAWYPQARFVGLVRDPRAYLASYKNYHRKQIAAYRNRYDPVANTLLWRGYMNALTAAQDGPLQDRLLTVRYEDFVQDPAGKLAEICGFLGLDPRPEMLAIQRQNSSYFEVSQDDKVTGISTGSLARWKETLTGTETWLVETFTGPLMERFDYSREGCRLTPRAALEFAGFGLRAPLRIYNLLFRTGKPFTREKARKAWRSIRARQSS